MGRKNQRNFTYVLSGSGKAHPNANINQRRLAMENEIKDVVEGYGRLRQIRRRLNSILEKYMQNGTIQSYGENEGNDFLNGRRVDVTFRGEYIYGEPFTFGAERTS